MRTRFAPSPTGFLHIGGLRTALYSYLLAKKENGTFILRVEDTDQVRTVEGALENIVSSLHWAGIDPDEGVMMQNGKIIQKGDYGPYIQSERFHIYKKHAQELWDNGHAYPCFCSAERLDAMRKDQQAHKQAPMYDRLCQSLSAEDIRTKIDAGEPYVLRLNVPRERIITFEDDIRGTVSFQGHTIDDQVLMKSDGFPTYHLANVVDDHSMNIDVVLRGEEWLSSTPKHILLFEAFGWGPPRYGHLPLLLNKDKSKLSKRQNDVSVQDYIDQGYLQETIVNFIALLGWNPGTTQEIFTMQELLDSFSMERIQKAGAVFDREKLDWLQGQWIRGIPSADFVARILPLVSERYPEAKTDPLFAEKAALIQERITFFKEAPDMLSYFYSEPTPAIDVIINAKQKVTEENAPDILQCLLDTLEPIAQDEWTLDTLKEVLPKKAEEKGYKLGQLLWPLRAAVTGLPYSPGAYEVAALVGKNATMQRLKLAQAVV